MRKPESRDMPKLSAFEVSAKFAVDKGADRLVRMIAELRVRRKEGNESRRRLEAEEDQILLDIALGKADRESLLELREKVDLEAREIKDAIRTVELLEGHAKHIRAATETIGRINVLRRSIESLERNIEILLVQESFIPRHYPQQMKGTRNSLIDLVNQTIKQLDERGLLTPEIRKDADALIKEWSTPRPHEQGLAAA